MALTKNEYIYTMQAQLSSIDVSSLTNLADSDKGSLEVLLGRISGSLDNVSIDNWADDVKNGVVTAASQIQEYIGKGIAATDFIAGACGPVSNLQSICNQYVEKYDDYLTEKYKDVKKYETENGTYKLNSSGDKIVSNKYIQWQQLLDAYEKTIPLIEADAIRIKTAVANYFSAVDLTTNTIDSSIYTEGSADISMDFSTYFNGFMNVTLDEWVGETTTEYSIDNEGHIIEKIEGEHTTQFEDGSHIDTHRTEKNTYDDINGDGEVDEKDELIYTSVHDEGTFTDAEGNVYGYIGDREEDQIGLVSNEVTLTDQDSGEEVYHDEENREYADEDTRVGMDVLEYSEEETEGDKTTYTWNSTSSIEGETISADNYSITMNNEPPGTGVYVDNDVKTEYYRNSDGQLCEVRSRNGQTLSEQTVDETQIRTFKIERDGEVIAEYQVNPNSGLDVARMRYDIDQARAEAGYSSESFDAQNIAFGMVNSGEYLHGIRTDEHNYSWSFE